MKRLFVSLFVSFCVFASSARSEPVAFNFTAVPLMDFAKVAYGNLLGRDFVVSSDLVNSGKKITVNVKAIELSAVPGFVENVLQAHGIRAVERGSIFFLEPAPVGGSMPLVSESPALAAPLAPAAPGLAVEEPAVVQAPQAEKKVQVLTLKNRAVPFVVEVLNTVYGAPVAVSGGGSRLVVSVLEDQADSVRDLVEQLDVPASVVEVSASFVEVTTTGTNARGLSLVADAVADRLGGVSIEPGDGRFSVRAGRYDLVLQALAGDGRFRQVSNSRVVGDDAERLSLSVGDETPTIASSSRDQVGNPIQNVVYRPSGVILDVLPKVLGSGRLSLLVDGQVSSFQATKTGVSGSPTLVKRQVKTSVSVADGQVLVIGGLDDAKSSSGDAGFSFLPKTWRNQEGTNSKTDLVLILSARVVPE